MIFYSYLPSGSRPVLSFPVDVNFLQVFFLYSIAECLRETGNTCDIAVLKVDFLQFIICVYMKTGVIDPM